MSSLCELCDRSPSVVYCSSCDLSLCLVNGCDAELHKPAKLQAHKRSKLEAKQNNSATAVSSSSVVCDNCDLSASVSCLDCSALYCPACDNEIHKPNKLKSHQRNRINSATNSQPSKPPQIIGATRSQAPPQPQLQSQSQPQPQQSSAASSPSVCDLCETSAPAVYCPDCDLYLCEANQCDQDVHKRGNEKSHKRNKINQTTANHHTNISASASANTGSQSAVALCSICDVRVSSVRCSDCSAFYCSEDDQEYHKPTKLQHHKRSSVQAAIQKPAAAPSSAPRPSISSPSNAPPVRPASAALPPPAASAAPAGPARNSVLLSPAAPVRPVSTPSNAASNGSITASPARPLQMQQALQHPRQSPSPAQAPSLPSAALPAPPGLPPAVRNSTSLSSTGASPNASSVPAFVPRPSISSTNSLPIAAPPAAASSPALPLPRPSLPSSVTQVAPAPIASVPSLLSPVPSAAASAPAAAIPLTSSCLVCDCATVDWDCLDCGASFCSTDEQEFHHPTKYRTHKRIRIIKANDGDSKAAPQADAIAASEKQPIVLCALCEVSEATVECIDCDAEYCAEDDAQLHQPAKLQSHQRRKLKTAQDQKAAIAPQPVINSAPATSSVPLQSSLSGIGSAPNTAPALILSPQPIVSSGPAALSSAPMPQPLVAPPLMNVPNSTSVGSTQNDSSRPPDSAFRLPASVPLAATLPSTIASPSPSLPSPGSPSRALSQPPAALPDSISSNAPMKPPITAVSSLSTPQSMGDVNVASTPFSAPRQSDPPQPAMASTTMPPGIASVTLAPLPVVSAAAPESLPLPNHSAEPSVASEASVTPSSSASSDSDDSSSAVCSVCDCSASVYCSTCLAWFCPSDDVHYHQRGKFQSHKRQIRSPAIASENDSPQIKSLTEAAPESGLLSSLQIEFAALKAQLEQMRQNGDQRVERDGMRAKRKSSRRQRTEPGPEQHSESESHERDEVSSEQESESDVESLRESESESDVSSQPSEESISNPAPASRDAFDQVSAQRDDSTQRVVREDESSSRDSPSRSALLAWMSDRSAAREAELRQAQQELKAIKLEKLRRKLPTNQRSGGKKEKGEEENDRDQEESEEIEWNRAAFGSSDVRPPLFGIPERRSVSLSPVGSSSVSDSLRQAEFRGLARSFVRSALQELKHSPSSTPITASALLSAARVHQQRWRSAAALLRPTVSSLHRLRPLPGVALSHEEAEMQDAMLVEEVKNAHRIRERKQSGDAGIMVIGLEPAKAMKNSKRKETNRRAIEEKERDSRHQSAAHSILIDPIRFCSSLATGRAKSSLPPLAQPHESDGEDSKDDIDASQRFSSPFLGLLLHRWRREAEAEAESNREQMHRQQKQSKTSKLA